MLVAVLCVGVAGVRHCLVNFFSHELFCEEPHQAASIKVNKVEGIHNYVQSYFELFLAAGRPKSSRQLLTEVSDTWIPSSCSLRSLMVQVKMPCS